MRCETCYTRRRPRCNGFRRPTPQLAEAEILARIVHEPPAATADMAVLPGVLGSRTLRRTDKYASGPSPCGCPVARPSPRSRDGVSCIMRASTFLKNSASARLIPQARAISSARPHSRTMHQFVVFRPACKAMVQGPTGQRGKRRLQMRLASEITRSPAFPPSGSMTWCLQHPARPVAPSSPRRTVPPSPTLASAGASW
jgi:hypothetical protein